MKRFALIQSLFISAAVLAGCSAAGLLNSVTPSGSFDRDKGLAYGELPRQTMDIYRAATPKAGAPLIVFVYGGGWTDGKKSMYKFVAEGFTKDGYDVVVPDYRLYPDSLYPDMITDTGAAIVKAGGLFPDRPLVLIGHSAGAYNVLMSALAPEISGVPVCDRVAGIVSLAGPTGAYPMTDEPYVTIFPNRLTADDAPINRADQPLPPVFLVNGDEDSTVGPENAKKMAHALTNAGHRASAMIYPDMNHIDPVRYLSRHFDGGSPLKADLLRFIESLPLGGPYCGRS